MQRILSSGVDGFKSYIKEYRRRKRSAEFYKENELNNPGEYYSKHCFDYYKCIFIHIPKSAGVSICKTLFGNYAGGHENIEWYLKKYGQGTVQKYFTFTFVRNPWERLYSAYFFLKGGGMNEKDRQFWEEHLAHIRSFESFVMEWLTADKIELYEHFIPQYKFITSSLDRNKILVNFTGRFENLEHDFMHVCKVLKLKKTELLKLNITAPNALQYSEYYNDKMIDKVAELYAQDIKLLNYSFSKK